MLTMLLTPGHTADLATARRNVERAQARVDQDEALYGKARVAKVHLRALSDATLRLLYLSALSVVERS